MNAEPLSCRWLTKRDMEPALELGAMHAWDRTDLLQHCKRRNCIASVCELDFKEIQAWIGYTLDQTSYHIENFAADDWEFGAAYELMQFVINKLGHRRDMITVDCPDTQDDILVFLRSCGFVVWQQVGETIHMRYDLPIKEELCVIGGETCRRSSGFPCLVPEGM